MTIRLTLVALISGLAIALLVSLGALAFSKISAHKETHKLMSAFLAVEHLSQASTSLMDERTSSYLELLMFAEKDHDLKAARRQVDAELKAATELLNQLGFSKFKFAIIQIKHELGLLRLRSDKIFSAESSNAGVPAADRQIAAFDGYTDIVRRCDALRLEALSVELPSDSEISNVFRIFGFVTLMIDQISLNHALVEGAHKQTAEKRVISILEAEKNMAQVEFLLELIDRQIDIGSAPINEKVDALISNFQTKLQPDVLSLHSSLITGSAPSALSANWHQQITEVSRNANELLEMLSSYARNRLEELHVQVDRNTFSTLAMAVLTVLAVAFGCFVVTFRIVRPLEMLEAGMLRLASGDFDAPIPETKRTDEMSRMTDSLRVFRDTAERRDMLQREQVALNKKLEDAYRAMKYDLEAAGLIQAALFPPPSTMGGVHFTSFHEASNFVAGDSYEFLRQSKNRLGFFLIDVTGHGAAAALISAVAHNAVAQAFLQREDGDGLDTIANRINRQWPSDLPFFTMILGELDPSTGSGTMVQAGHPNPLLVSDTGVLKKLGLGGVPVGVLPESEYEEVKFRFSPGDKLLVYSDGLTDAENADGHGFSTERLEALVIDLVRRGSKVMVNDIVREVRAWIGSNNPVDDITIVMLEATVDFEFNRNDARRHSGVTAGKQTA